MGQPATSSELPPTLWSPWGSSITALGVFVRGLTPPRQSSPVIGGSVITEPSVVSTYVGALVGDSAESPKVRNGSVGCTEFSKVTLLISFILLDFSPSKCPRRSSSDRAVHLDSTCVCNCGALNRHQWRQKEKALQGVAD